MFGSPRNAYDSAAKASVSNRELEAHALFKAAQLLESCRHGWDASDRPARLEEALDYHQRLWTFFQAELSDPAHPLDPELRSRLLSLSLFLDRRVLQVRQQPDPASLEPLIRINREIALGLSSHAGGAERPKAA